MSLVGKHAQLQIRVSEEEKTAIRDAARRAGMDMSAYILSRVLPAPAREFQEAVAALAGSAAPSFALARMNEFLSKLALGELRDAVADAPEVALEPFLLNYIAAMVEVACQKQNIRLPNWTRGVAPLDEPVFGSALRSLRLHLLTHSPAAFRRRNIFIDATIGDRV